MIRLSNVHKSYRKKHVLKGIDLTFDGGCITAVLGPNGSGKTTLIKSVIGMVIPQRGEITVNDLLTRGESRYRQWIAYLPQMAKFPENLTVREIIAMVSDLRQAEAKPEPLLKSFKLDAQLDQPLKTLSGGMLQKVNLLLTFMVDCEYVILDEPTTGLDPMAMQHLRKLLVTLKNEGKTVLFTTHIMSFAAEMADRIVYLLDGNIYFDGVEKELLVKYGESNLEGAIAKMLQEHGATDLQVQRKLLQYSEK